ncbi:MULTISPECIES: hypothetical protein [Methylomonas]|uniref:Uncharacterized protein n=1 Tax=Methylomonas koyamae TaxID=702114 RepID=A0A177NRQ7_9GAMM|nr:hypothetical protein [Methylomonas koyamae]OAI19983.1 hypothetical protein A1355_03285 [Methylomonas koyamae]
MKDQTDQQTIELFPTPKRRGRPSTGKAKTNAERQADFRNRKAWRGGSDNNGHKLCHWWLDYRRFSELECLASYHGVTPQAMVEQLIQSADKQLISQLTQTAYFDYVDKKLHVTESKPE